MSTSTIPFIHCTTLELSHVVFPLQDLCFIESFAGNAEATKAVRAQFPSHAAASIDVKFSEYLDINTNGGFGILVQFHHYFPLFSLHVWDSGFAGPLSRSEFFHL